MADNTGKKEGKVGSGRIFPSSFFPLSLLSCSSAGDSQSHRQVHNGERGKRKRRDRKEIGRAREEKLKTKWGLI